MNMFRFSVAKLAATAALSALLMTPSIAGATTSDDSSLANGVYFGTNNANAHFAVSTSNGIELGLSALLRYITPVTPEAGTGIYDVPTGATTAPGQTGSSWAVAFSLDTNYDGTSGLTLADISSLTLSFFDVNTGFSGGANVLPIPDNAYNGNTGVQNAEAGDFIATFLGDTGFDVNSADTYIVSLTAYGFGQIPADQVFGPILASDSITINAVPEPASLALLGGGLAGLGMLRRRKKA